MAEDQHQQDSIQSLLNRQDDLIKKIAALVESRKKDKWDKLAAVSGILVALVGGIFSGIYYYYQSKQDATAKEQSAKLQHIEAVGRLMPYLIGTDSRAKSIALAEVGNFDVKTGVLIAERVKAGENDQGDPVVDYLQYIVNTETGEVQALAKNALIKIVGKVGTVGAACANPSYPATQAAPIDDACVVAGNGGAETAQNVTKNNFCASLPAKSVTIADLIELQRKAEAQNINFGGISNHPLTSAPGPIQDRTSLTKLGEGDEVVLQGYVLIARQEGPESVNCGANVPNDPIYHDIHISIVQNPGDPECSGVVVEMSPRHRPTQWTAQLINQVASARLLVRVTGQRMFDSSHNPCVNGTPVQGDPKRDSLWEIHPIYQFEVCPHDSCSSGGWVKLESWKST